MSITVAEVKKFIVALVGAAGQVLALGLLHGTVEHVVVVAVAILTAAGVYVTPNDTANKKSLP